MAPPKERPLSAKHQAFVDQYVIDRNATRAYREVYKCTAAAAGANGAKLLKNARIALEIAGRVQSASERSTVTVAYVLENLTEIVERCMQRAPVMVKNPDGPGMVQAQDEEGRDVWTFDSRGANTALTTIAKHLGMLKDPKADALTDIANALRAARERASRR